MFSFSLSLSVSVWLAFLIMFPIALEHCWCASFVVMGDSGWSIWFIFWFMCGGIRFGSAMISGYCFIVWLHSFRSFASLSICLIPALEIGGLNVVVVVGSCLVSCIGHILVAMSLYV